MHSARCVQVADVQPSKLLRVMENHTIADVCVVAALTKTISYLGIERGFGKRGQSFEVLSTECRTSWEEEITILWSMTFMGTAPSVNM